VAEIPKKIQFQNLTDLIFGKLTVLEYRGRSVARVGRSKWLCRCECGATLTVLARRLKSGEKKHCGCLSRRKPVKGSITNYFPGSEYNQEQVEFLRQIIKLKEKKPAATELDAFRLAMSLGYKKVCPRQNPTPFVRPL
jgi:hypothetical protein